MMVEPDFPDHWKTQLLISLVGEEIDARATEEPAHTHGEPTTDPREGQSIPTLNPAPEGAPMLVIRLWCHCHQRKRWRFPEMSNLALKAVTGWKGDALRLRHILMEAGFIEQDMSQVVVHEWDKVNWILCRNWENGAKHKGRFGKKTEPTANPRDTHGGSLPERSVGAIKKDKERERTHAGAQARACEREEILDALCPIFGTDPKRPLSAAVDYALREAGPVTAAELRAVVWFYAQEGDDRGKAIIGRHQKLKTLFENWSDVVLQAEALRKKIGGDFSREKKAAPPEPEGWRQRMQKKFGAGVELPESFFELPKSLQADPAISQADPA